MCDCPVLRNCYSKVKSNQDSVARPPSDIPVVAHDAELRPLHVCQYETFDGVSKRADFLTVSAQRCNQPCRKPRGCVLHRRCAAV